MVSNGLSLGPEQQGGAGWSWSTKYSTTAGRKGAACGMHTPTTVSGNVKKSLRYAHDSHEQGPCTSEQSDTWYRYVFVRVLDLVYTQAN